jgi:hypothetical protein
MKAIHKANAAGNSLQAKENKQLWKAARRFFDSWANALRHAGIDPSEAMGKHGHWRPKEILRELRAAFRRGELRHGNGFHRKHTGLVFAAVRFFGSWHGALDAAGVPPPEREPAWTYEKVKTRIQERLDRGLSIRSTEVFREEPGFYVGARKLFGKPWSGLVQELGFQYTGYRRWSKEAIVKEIHRLHQAGHELHGTAIRRIAHPLLVASRAHYGSWDAAMRAAGLDS